MIFKAIYKIYFDKCLKKSNEIMAEKLPIHYYEKNKLYYIYPNYLPLARIFKVTVILIIIILHIIIGITYYLKGITFSNIITIVEPFIILILMLLEFSSYFDGMKEEVNTDTINNKTDTKEKNIVLEEINQEYHKIWKNKLIGNYDVKSNYKCRIIENSQNQDSLSDQIANSTSDNQLNHFLHSRILFPIISGEDIIIESCLLESFADIIVPIVNIMFTASKKMMFICDTRETVRACEKWFEELELKANTSNSNIVVEVLDYQNNLSYQTDNNVDIYIGTVDLALDNKTIYENIDVIFCINIDKIISENALCLNILASSISSNRYDNVQYVLFGNRVNGLKQTASQVFMRNDFTYQVVKNSVKNNFMTNFWASEKGWLQSDILPNFATQYLGQLIPLTMPCFKYNIDNVDVISTSQSFKDQILSLQTAQPLLKKYMKKDIININEATKFSENENFVKINDKSVVILGDTNNNAALPVLNWLKYSKSDMLLNIVTDAYLLRNYIIANMDFYIGNAEVIGNILTFPKSNIKLSVYKLLNQLCQGNISEETLLREIQKQETDIQIDMFDSDQIRFITESLHALTKRAFGINIFFSSYLTSKKISKDTTIETKRYYKLLDSIKKELPEQLFKNITFIDAEQSAKVLKKIPVFELYQNYLEGQ